MIIRRNIITRGTTYSDEKGHYFFNTISPVPYSDGGGHMRPAHFHLMITAGSYQPLVTQLYFSGDSFIKTDRFASSPSAQRRILDVQTMSDGTKKVVFDVNMSDILPVEAAALRSWHQMMYNSPIVGLTINW